MDNIYAGFWKRAAATSIDGIIFSPLNLLSNEKIWGNKYTQTRCPVVNFEVEAHNDKFYELALGNIKRVFQEAWSK